MLLCSQFHLWIQAHPIPLLDQHALSDQWHHCILLLQLALQPPLLQYIQYIHYVRVVRSIQWPRFHLSFPRIQLVQCFQTVRYPLVGLVDQNHLVDQKVPVCLGVLVDQPVQTHLCNQCRRLYLDVQADLRDH